MSKPRAIIFDWGDTVMRDFPEYKGPMAGWPRVEAIEGIQDTLTAIHSEMTCCLASNAGDSDALLMGKALERVALRQYFRHLFTARELGAQKPDPDFYTGILDILKMKPADCVAVGNDYNKDIAPARSIGMRTVWFSPLPDPGQEHAAEHIISSMKELATVLESEKK